MPFTFAHPAIFIPFQKVITRKLSVTGLILGSLIPDFEYFLKMEAGKNISHHWLGVLIFDIPVAFLFTFLFHNIVRNLFIINSPNWIKNRFYQYVNFNWNSYFLVNKFKVFISILIGVLSHLFLDAFTHYDGLFVVYFLNLSITVNVLSHKIPYYLILQILGSIIGLIYGYLYMVNFKINNYKQEVVSKIGFYWLTIIIVATCLFVIRLIVLPNRLSFWDVFMASMGSLIYSFIITGIYQTVFFNLFGKNNGNSNKLI